MDQENTITLHDGTTYTLDNSITISSSTIDALTIGDTWASTTVFDVTESTIDGIPLKDELSSIKKQLLLLSRDISMEEKYPELKNAYDIYNSVLKNLIAMEKITGDDKIE